jgi:hypothetical protein
MPSSVMRSAHSLDAVGSISLLARITSTGLVPLNSR